MAARILPKSLPRDILKRANARFEHDLLEFECKRYPRSLSDKEVHGMLQDLLDAGGLHAWNIEFKITLYHHNFKNDIDSAHSNLTVLDFPKRKKRN